MGNDYEVERSKLLNQHKQEISALAKEVKKKKGALKEEAQAKLDAAEERHEQELKDLEEKMTGGGSKGKDKGKDKDKSSKDKGKEKEKKDKKEKKKEKVKIFPVRQWSGLGKSELEEECVLRGLSKKGNKEALISRLSIFSSEQEALKKMEGASLDDKPGSGSQAAPDSSDSDSDASDDDMTPEQREEAERQAKKEMMFQKALRVVVKKNPKGLALDNLCDELEKVGVKNFGPEKLGYTTLEQLIRSQPEELCWYDKDKKTIHPEEPGSDDDDDDSESD